MRKKKEFIRVCLVLIISVFLLDGCNIKGANQPYTYAPRTSHSVWNPPEKALKRVPTEDFQKEVEDYESFSRERPMSLAEIIDIALYRSPSTKQSWANARVSAAEYGQSLQNDFILADIEGDYTRTRFAEFQGPERTIVYETQYGAELQLTYTILDFGQTRYTSEAALQSLYNADWSHNSQIQATIQTLMNDYYNYLYQKQLLFASEQDVVNAKTSLDATEEKFRNGLADVTDIVQAKTSYLQQKLSVVNQKQSLHNAYTQLVNDMGLPSNGVLFFQDYPKTIETFDIEKLDSLIVKANDNRPDLLAAESNVKSQVANVRAARAKKFPIITGEFDIGRQYYQHGLNDTYDFTAQINLTFPLFQGFFIENSIKVARAQLEEANAELEQVKLGVVQEVANYRDDVLFARESIEYAQAYLSSAEEDFKANLKKYKVGTGTIVELINAQTNVSDARAKLAQAQNSWYTSIANLAYSTGILFPPSNQDHSPYLELIKQKESRHEKATY